MTPAKVARIGRRDYTKAELPPTIWRAYLRATARFFLLALLGWLCFGLILAALVVK